MAPPSSMPLRFSFLGSRPPPSVEATPPVASASISGAHDTEESVAVDARPNNMEPIVVEILEDNLAVVNLEGASVAADILRQAAKSRGLFAAIRNTGKLGGCWCVIDVTATPLTDDYKKACSNVAGLRLQRRPSSSVDPLENLVVICHHLTNARLEPRPLTANCEEVVLVDHENVTAAAQALVRAGHGVTPPGRVASGPDFDDTPETRFAEKLCGVWRLVKRELLLSSSEETFSRAEAPMRIQAHSGVWVEVGISKSGEVAGQTSCVGMLSSAESGPDGELAIERHATISFEPPCGGARKYQVALEAGGGDEGEDVAIETLLGAGPRGDEPEVVERWERIATGDVTVLELANIDPKPAGGDHGGFWLFCGGHWLRCTGPMLGEGLIAGTCCRSHAQAQKLHGAEIVDEELRTHYRASYGTYAKPGYLNINRDAWNAVPELGKAFYDASNSRDEVRKEDDVVVHAPAVGPMTAWEVRTFGVDPFTPVASKGKEKAQAPEGLRKKREKSSSSDGGSSSAKSSGSSNTAKGKKGGKKVPKGSDSSSEEEKAKKGKKKVSKGSDSSSEEEKASKEKEKSKAKSSSESSSPRKCRNRSSDKKKDKDRAKSRSREKKDRDKSRERKDKDRSRSRDKRDKDRSKDRSRAREKKDKGRDRSRDRDKRDRSRDRDRKGRDRSRDRDRDKKARSRSRSRDRDKREKDRSRERDKRGKAHSRSRDRDRKDRSRDRSRSRKKRSKSRDKKDRSRSRGRRERSRDKKARSRSKDRSRDRKEKDKSRDKSKAREKEKDKEKDAKTRGRSAKKSDEKKSKKDSSSSSGGKKKKKKDKKRKKDDSSADTDEKSDAEGKPKGRAKDSDSDGEDAKKSDAKESDSDGDAGKKGAKEGTEIEIKESESDADKKSEKKKTKKANSSEDGKKKKKKKKKKSDSSDDDKDEKASEKSVKSEASEKSKASKKSSPSKKNKDEKTVNIESSSDD